MNGKILLSLGAFAVIAAGALALAEEKLTVDKLPAAVQSTAKQIIGDATVTDCDSDSDNGKTTYEVEFTAKGTECSIELDATGNVTEFEVDVPVNIVPPSVLNAAKTAHTDGTVSEASIVNSGGQLVYELDVKSGKDKYEMHVNGDGTVKSDAKEEEDKD